MEEEEEVARALRQLIDDVLDLADALDASGNAIAATAGQTRARWHSLLWAAPGNYTVPDIARRLGRHRQSVQRVTDDLAAGGLARYAPNPDHARSPLVQLTPAGHDALAKIEETARQRRLANAGSFDAAEIATARAVLAQLLAATRAVAAASPPDGQAPPDA